MVLTDPSDLDVQPRQLWSWTSDSAPSQRENGGLGRIPLKVRCGTNSCIGPGCSAKAVITSDSAPSEARNRGSGGSTKAL